MTNSENRAAMAEARKADADARYKRSCEAIAAALIVRDILGGPK